MSCVYKTHWGLSYGIEARRGIHVRVGFCTLRISGIYGALRCENKITPFSQMSFYELNMSQAKGRMRSDESMLPETAVLMLLYQFLSCFPSEHHTQAVIFNSWDASRCRSASL